MNKIKSTWVHQKFFCRHDWCINNCKNPITKAYGNYLVKVCTKCGKVEKLEYLKPIRSCEECIILKKI